MDSLLSHQAEPTGTEEDKFNKTQDVSLDDQDEEAKELASLIEAKSCGAYVCLAIALGMDTGLFDVMIALAQPKTCQEIADAGNLKERYMYTLILNLKKQKNFRLISAD